MDLDVIKTIAKSSCNYETKFFWKESFKNREGVLCDFYTKWKILLAFKQKTRVREEIDCALDFFI